LELPDVRKAIHVGKLPFNNGTVVEQHLKDDVLQSVKPWLAEVMNFYKVSFIYL
jgi:vitellogenic carboxypeptidase-like protein